MFDLDQLINAFQRDGTAAVTLEDTGGDPALARRVLTSAAYQAGLVSDEAELNFRESDTQVVGTVERKEAVGD